MAEDYRSARRITLITRDPSGKVSTEIRYRKARRKKKGTPGLRSLDDLVRRMIRADVAMENSYLSRHDRSNEDRSDGWLLDLETNIVNAMRTGIKNLEKDDDEDDDNLEKDDDEDDDDIET